MKDKNIGIDILHLSKWILLGPTTSQLSTETNSLLSQKVITIRFCTLLDRLYILMADYMTIQCII